MTRTAAHRPRNGFTLVELLVVLSIIALLVALLIPAVGAAVRAARAAAVQAEINSMAQALADFKNKYTDYPPSSVVLDETGNSTTMSALGPRTLSAMRKFWPRVTFTTGGLPTTWYDFNGDGVRPVAPALTYYRLQGHECLVFFLGGIPVQVTPTTFGMTGFGSSPTNPFTNSIVGSVAYNANRTPPLYEFAGDRLVVTAGSPSNFPGYIDSLGSQSGRQNFYAYFSTNNGAGYDPNDINFDNPDNEVDANLVHPLNLTFATTSGAVISASPNPYTTSLPAGGTTVAFQNPQTFQIISPGADGTYGLGGLYNPNSAADPLPITGITTNSTDLGIRQLEADNLTNFHNGKLK